MRDSEKERLREWEIERLSEGEVERRENLHIKRLRERILSEKDGKREGRWILGERGRERVG